MPPLCLVVFAAAAILSPLILRCQAAAPIIWPDPRLFRASLVPFNKVYVNLDWPITTYLQPDYLLSSSVIIKQVGNANYSKTIERNLMLPIKLDSSNTEYLLTYILKTALYPQGVSVSTKIKTGGETTVTEESSKISELSHIRISDDEPRIIVLKDKSTRKCLLIIYDQSVENGRYTIEAIGECENDNRATVAVTLPMRRRPSEILPDLRLLDFDLNSRYLKGISNFKVFAYWLFQEKSYEVDPPCDVYGKLQLTSPDSANLTISFRPPASNPKHIKNFTFAINPTGETVVLHVVKDDTDTNRVGGSTERGDQQDFSSVQGPFGFCARKTGTIEIFQHSGDNAIPFSKILEAQSNKDVNLEFVAKSITEYPGNFTLTAFTNNAKIRKAIHPIILPELRLSVPYRPEIRVINRAISVNWYKPSFFGDRCEYTVEAIPTVDKSAAIFRLVPAPLNPQWKVVHFDSLKPGTNYAFYIETQCGHSKPQRIKVGEKESNPGTPGAPQGPHLTLADPWTMNFTWKAPALLLGRENYFEWSCHHLQSKSLKEGKTTNTYVLVKFDQGNVSCLVRAVSKTPDHEEMKGINSRPVYLVVPRQVVYLSKHDYLLGVLLIAFGSLIGIVLIGIVIMGIAHWRKKNAARMFQNSSDINWSDIDSIRRRVEADTLSIQSQLG
ncbi:hypothetical protein Aperf_G00000120038 [Anoplocephala perfoliata]